MTNSRPLIGISISRRENEGNPQLALPEAYAVAVEEAGGDCILIPPGISKDGLIKLLTILDGILLSGGGDVHPRRYGGMEHPLVSDVNQDRDQLEFDLVALAYQTNLPLLGICRGLQVINTALGGTIYEDLLDQKPGALNHRTPGEFPRHYLAHTVEIIPDSRLFEILQNKHCSVNSHHHQGIRELATPLVPTAYAPDGLIEAIEIPDLRFFLAVQWHPECMLPEANMNALFTAFIQSTRK